MNKFKYVDSYIYHLSYCQNREQVFKDQGVELMRMNVQSLAPGLKIETPVIDTFASILNYEEWLSDKEIKRHYFYTSMMVR